MSNLINRRELLQNFAQQELNLNLGLICTNQSIKKDVDFTTVISTPNTQSPSNQNWEQLTPKERIIRIEAGQEPKVAGFNPRQQLVKAVAEVCSEHFQPSDSANFNNMVTYQGQSAFRRTLIQVSEQFGDSTDGKRIAKEAKEVIELVNKPHDMIFVNVAQLPYYINVIRASYPKPSSSINLATAVEKSLLLHAFSHLPQGEEEVPINPIHLENGVITSFNGFRFQGQTTTGQPFIKTGALEALTDVVGHYLCRDLGNYYSPPQFKIGRDLLEDVLARAKISGVELIQFNNRTRPLPELLERIDRIKAISAGGNVPVKVFLFIAFALSGDIDKRTAEAEINKLLIT